MPSPDDYDFSHVAEACEANKQYAIHVGGAGTACIINTAGFFRSMEQVFCDLALDDPAGLLLIDRFLGVDLEVISRTLAAAPKGAIDFMWIGEDLGTQEGPMISMDMLKKHMMPGGGYCFAPTHCLQDNSPTENVVAMYETAMQYGRYP